MPHRTPYPGGAPANVACALTRLGVPVAFVGAMGEDELGQQMLALLQGAWEGNGCVGRQWSIIRLRY